MSCGSKDINLEEPHPLALQSGTVSNTTPTLLIDALQISKHGCVNWFSGTHSWPCGYSKKPVMAAF